MTGSASRFVTACALAAVVLAGGSSGQAGQPSTAKGEWPHYTADLKGSRYSPPAQIDASNFAKLEVAWRFKTDNLGPFPEYKLEGTPLMVNGVLYTTGGTRRSVIALDAQDRRADLVAQPARRQARRRLAAPAVGPRRLVLDRRQGRRAHPLRHDRLSARRAERQDRRADRVVRQQRHRRSEGRRGQGHAASQIDLETGEIGVHSTPTIVKDIVIVGSAMREGATVETHNNTKGLVRAFDVRTGKKLWQFNTIPRPGEFGNDTWENESWADNGNVGVWTQITVDEELGLVYLPVETPSSDFYGGHRPGNNLFAESLVCVDLKTGQRKWHFQFVHHPIWNYDMSSAPLLADVTVDGRPRKVVAVPSKQAWLYVFDRVTGEPVWPIEERPVPQSDVPGEKYAPTQPHPPEALRYARNFLNVPDDLIDFTPELRAEALES